MFLAEPLVGMGWQWPGHVGVIEVDTEMGLRVNVRLGIFRAIGPESGIAGISVRNGVGQLLISLQRCLILI